MKAEINPTMCDRSPFCPARRVCPQGAIGVENGSYKVNSEQCIGCGKCVRVCPHGAVSMLKE